MAEAKIGWYNSFQLKNISSRLSLNFPPFRLIQDKSSWGTCLAKLKTEPSIAVDLEANSLYAYREQVCLIQISIPGQDYIVDPIVGLDLTEFGSLIQDPAVNKVFHAAEYDLILLKREFGWQLNNLFDTMWAARILGYNRYGLANILEQFYDVKLNKKFQKANWCRRPLSKDQLTYAQMDTHYLLRLRDDLAYELKQANRLDEAADIFAEQSQVKLSDNKFDPDDFWSINGVRKLNPRQQAAAKAINIFRDKQARLKNRPLFKIFNDKTLVELAQQLPKRRDELASVYGMSPGQINRYGHKLIKIIQASESVPPPKKPKRNNNNRPSDEVYERYERLHTWRKKRAQKRGVESDVILSRSTLWSIAYANPTSIDELSELDKIGPWRHEAYGDEIINILNGN